MPCSGNPLFQYNSLNKALKIIKSRRISLGQIQFSGISEMLIVDWTVHLPQIKSPFQKTPLETAENVVVSSYLCLWMKYTVYETTKCRA